MWHSMTGQLDYMVILSIWQLDLWLMLFMVRFTMLLVHNLSLTCAATQPILNIQNIKIFAIYSIAHLQYSELISL